MAHAGVKNAYRATIHTWRWAWHLKPRVVRRLSAALSTSVTTNSLKLIMNDPFWEFVQLHSAEYGARTHTRAESGGSCYVSNQHFFRIVVSKEEARKALRCIVKWKTMLKSGSTRWAGYWLKAFCGGNSYVRKKPHWNFKATTLPN